MRKANITSTITHRNSSDFEKTAPISGRFFVTKVSNMRYNTRMDAKVLELVIQAKNGDQTAFGGLYDMFADKLFRYIRIKIQNKQQAEDILQEAFIKTWRNLHLFTVEGGNFQAWMYRITSNCMNDYFRKIYRQPESLELNENIDKPSGENLQKAVADKFETEQLLQAFDLLPAQYKEILELRFVQDLSPDETAKILNKSNLAVRVLQHRALKKLRGVVKKSESDGLSGFGERV